MAYPPPPPILIDIADDCDDEEFDWEAAVREIDSACEASVPPATAAATTASTSVSEQPLCLTPTAGGSSAVCPIRVARRASKPRQSTLDRFVDRRSKRRDDGAGRRPGKAVLVDVDTDGNFAGGNGHSDGRVGVEIDLEAAKTWIYPINVPLRDYQFSIAKMALFTNMLVALPTGLGKTLIAAVVMYNYFRWFPEGKIVFAAPSRPLVVQQIDACLNIVGIPRECAIDMTGLKSPPKRSELWNAKRVFFVTPQVLERDIQSGICNMKQMVCLVIDEAHRASGNYSYCVVVRELMAIPVHLRILALTATPGSKQQTVQNVIDNLNISRLEYRSETDQDVTPYVQNRKFELIEVPMGKDAVAISDLLLEIIKPYVQKLCSRGVLQNRDFTKLSPCELLTSRDTFRTSPPHNLPDAIVKEIDGYFGYLLTLYHVRKLLSSHGIKPAYDMLEEKLKNWPFSKLSSNDNMRKVRSSMSNSLSHGAPNPKLLKMVEILTEHFKSKDPRTSRVIIFSNFRGSVRDIMTSLHNLGEIVQATEFIGQSSGKTLKGQTQKVQQAILKKFRDGEYNVLVATSIGEEGLDIMEVDLVICFDANISPLRMIQRMGRTGRKNDGRVVVLACQGQELKGYLRKQANSKAINKHMYNGGIKSFSFHPSPRMVPHICKPEVEFVEISIEKSVPHGKDLKESPRNESPLLRKISNVESDLISRYFHQSMEDTSRLSLIAFPLFQAFPSRVHKVKHSFKTTAMFIDAAQHLQGLVTCNGKGAFSNEVKHSAKVLDTENYTRDSLRVLHGVHHSIGSSHPEASVLRNRTRAADCDILAPAPSKPPVHHFLFDTNIVAVNALGNVIVNCVPSLPLCNEIFCSKNSLTGHKPILWDSAIEDTCFYDTASSKAAPKHTNISESSCRESNGMLACKSHIFEVKELQEIPEMDTVPETPACKKKMFNTNNYSAETFDVEKVNPVSLVSMMADTIRDMELSPRLTHFIENGVVPESPTVTNSLNKFEQVQSTNFMHENGSCGLLMKCPTSKQRETCTIGGLHLSNFQNSPKNMEASYGQYCKLSENINLCNISSLKVESPNRTDMKRDSNGSPGSPVNEVCTPIVNQINYSSSDDWRLNSGNVQKSVEYVTKYKRLRKYTDIIRGSCSKTLRGEGSTATTNSHLHQRKKNSNLAEGQNKAVVHAKTFIEEEAEVSSDAEVSEDEEDDKDEDKYDDSFIDDRINPTDASTQVENSGGMMAFYRRSLLTQSPLNTSPCNLSFSTHESHSLKSAESGSCSSGRIDNSLRTPQDDTPLANQDTHQNSVNHRLATQSGSRVANTSKANSVYGYQRTLESRKRKLSFQYVELPHVSGIQPKCIFQADGEEQKTDVFYDDDFYTSLDFDALEAQAANLLRNKSELSMSTEAMPNGSLLGENPTRTVELPSFDLGI